MRTRAIHFLFGQRVPRCDHRIDKEFDYYVLQYMESGEVDLEIGEKRYRLKGPYFWSSYPGVRIRFRPADGSGTWFHRYLAFRGRGVRRWIEDGLFPLAPQVPSPAGGYGKRFDELLELARYTDRWKVARAALALETILTELAEERARPSTPPPWLQPSLASLGATGAKIDYARIARDAGMSERNFRRCFFKAMGTSPRAYVIANRVSQAMRMLGDSELPIKVIARELGYSDVFFFSRQFTQSTGVSPAAYRRSRQA